MGPIEFQNIKHNYLWVFCVCELFTVFTYLVLDWRVLCGICGDKPQWINGCQSPNCYPLTYVIHTLLLTLFIYLLPTLIYFCIFSQLNSESSANN